MSRRTSWPGVLGLFALLFSSAQARAQTPPDASPSSSPAPAPAGCTKDTDCKGDRVCDRGQCVAAPPPATASTPSPAGEPPVLAPPPPPPPAAQPQAEASAAAQAPVVRDPTADFFFLSVERIFGFSYWTVSQKLNGAADGSADGFNLSVLAGATSPAAVPAMAYQIPRLGFDFAVYRGLTLGAALGFFHGESETIDTKNVSKGQPNLTLLMAAPRVGYRIDLSEKFSLWPRAGITAFSFGEDRTDSKGVKSSTATGGSALTLEGMLILRPIPHWGILGGITADIGLSGGIKETPAPSTPKDVGLSATAIGVTGGGVVSF